MNIYVIVLKNSVTNKFIESPVVQCFTSKQAFGILRHQFPEVHGHHIDVCDYYGTPQAQPLKYVVTKRQFDAHNVQVTL